MPGMATGRIVWDDDYGGARPPAKKPDGPPPGDGIVRIRRETSGRGGKTVTTVSGVPVGEAALQELAKALKKRCGVGGAVKDHVIEIQGDHRDAVEAFLKEQGYTVKRAGG